MAVVRRVHFEYLGDVKWDIQAADVSNPVFNALSTVYLRPLALAASLGRLSEERATAALARVYANAVLVGSPVPELASLGLQEREEWLLSHPEEFRRLREIAECESNFVDEDA